MSEVGSRQSAVGRGPAKKREAWHPGWRHQWEEATNRLERVRAWVNECTDVWRGIMLARDLDALEDHINRLELLLSQRNSVGKEP